jgi:hypothetical protein
MVSFVIGGALVGHSSFPNLVTSPHFGDDAGAVEAA